MKAVILSVIFIASSLVPPTGALAQEKGPTFGPKCGQKVGTFKRERVQRKLCWSCYG